MKRLSRRNARKWTHEVAAWLEYARVMWGIGSKRGWHVGKNLAGGCWIASFILLQKLRVMGVRAGIVYDTINGHAFVQTSCGWTLDPTFGQFADEYGFRPMPHITRERVGADHGYPAHVLLHPETSWHPALPIRHLRIINRILRRMGLAEVKP